MRAPIRRMGNSAGIILQKPVLEELGLGVGDDLSLTKPHPRAGWAEAAKHLAAVSSDGLVWPEFGNLGDDDLNW